MSYQNGNTYFAITFITTGGTSFNCLVKDITCIISLSLGIQWDAKK